MLMDFYLHSLQHFGKSFPCVFSLNSMDGGPYSSMGNIMLVLYDTQHFRACGHLQEYFFSIFANTLEQNKANVNKLHRDIIWGCGQEDIPLSLIIILWLIEPSKHSNCYPKIQNIMVIARNDSK